MPCPELERLRAQAREFNQQLSEKVRKSQEFPAEDGHSGRTDYEMFLKNRLIRTELEIRQHLEQHGCD
jgi:hypothetical protein